MCRCQRGYTGLRCELKLVNSGIPVGAISIAMGVAIFLIIIISLVLIIKRLTRFEAILLAADKQRLNNGVLSQKLLSQGQVNGGQSSTNHPASGHKYLHCDGQVNMERLELTRAHQSLHGLNGAGVTKSSSSPVMATSASPGDRGGLASSQSSTSVTSCGSIKHRRHHPASDTLTLTLCPPGPDEGPAQERVSPLYIGRYKKRDLCWIKNRFSEPWDKLGTCVHGRERHVTCGACQQELDSIINTCDMYLKSK